MFLKKGIALSLICLLGFGVMGCSNNSGESKESLKKENGEEYIRITFERPKEYGFDTYVIELPNYNVVLEDGNYSDDEKKTFLEIVKNGASFFFKYARIGGLEIA